MSGTDDEFEAEMYAISVIAEWNDKYKPPSQNPIEHRTFLIHLIYSTLDLQTDQLHEIFSHVLNFLSSKQSLIDEFALLNSIKILVSIQAEPEPDTRSPSSD